MKKLNKTLTIAAMLLGMAMTGVRAAESEWWGYILGSPPRNVQNPSGEHHLNCILPENNGGFIAVWDNPASSIVERRDNNSVLLWSRTFTPSTAGEDTRLALRSATRTLWATPVRWFYLNTTNGEPVASGTWNLPDLDANKVVIQNDVLHILQGNTALMFDTNMVCLGTINVTLPTGAWTSHAGAWLIDLNDRTNYLVRAVVLGPGLQPVRTLEVPLAGAAPGGYVQHRVLSGDMNTIFVLSSITFYTSTTFFFTMFDRNGAVYFKHKMNVNACITGCANVSDAWLLSGTTLTETPALHFLCRINRLGVPGSLVYIDRSSERRYVTLNADPPAVLQVVTNQPFALYPTLLRSRDAVHLPIQDIPVTLQTYLPGEPPVGDTNQFWITSTLRNNAF